MEEILKKLELAIELMSKSQNTETQEIMKSVTEMKDAIAKMNGLSEEDKAKIAKFDEMENQIKKMAEEMDRIMKNGNVNSNSTDEFAKYEQELNAYFKSGDKTELIAKAFDTSAGGALIPEPRANEIIKQIQETSPLLRDAKMYRIGQGDSLTIPVKNAGTNNAAVQAEGVEAGSESVMNYGTLKLEVEKVTTWVSVTSEMIEDSDFNVVAEVTETSRENIAEFLSKKVWNGETTDKIVGVYKDTTVTSAALETATQSVVTWEDLKNLIYSLKPNVRRNSAFYVSTAMLSAMRGFKDQDNRPLYVESLVAGEPGLFMGYRVYEDTFMDEVADGKYPAFFGNMGKFYAWLIRKGVYAERDRKVGKDTYDFYTRIRIGGKVRDKEQGKLLKVKGA